MGQEKTTCQDRFATVSIALEIEPRQLQICAALIFRQVTNSLRSLLASLGMSTGLLDPSANIGEAFEHWQPKPNSLPRQGCLMGCPCLWHGVSEDVARNHCSLPSRLRCIQFLPPVYFRVREVLSNLWKVESITVLDHILETLGNSTHLL